MANYNGQFQDSEANNLLATPHSYANIEGATASQAYLKGQMMVFNNRLCTVTATIAQGDTLTVGTNIAYKSVGDIGKQLVATDGTGFYFDVKDGEYGFYPTAAKQAADFVPFGGSDLYTQSKSATGASSANQYDYKSITFTFNELTEVVGITNIGGLAAYTYTVPGFTISGNKVTIRFANMYSDVSHTTGASVTAIGYK